VSLSQEGPTGTANFVEVVATSPIAVRSLPDLGEGAYPVASPLGPMSLAWLELADAGGEPGPPSR